MELAPTEEELENLARSGGLLAAMAKRFQLYNANEVSAVCARLGGLHNAGRVDILALVDEYAVAGLQDHHAYLAEVVFQQVLPHLDITLDEALSFTASLSNRVGGPEGSSFQVWCAKRPGSAQKCIDAAMSGDARALNMLAPALVANADLNLIRTLCTSPEAPHRRSALIALGAASHPSPADLTASLSAAVEIAPEMRSEDEHGLLLRTSFILIAASGHEEPIANLERLRRLLEGAGEARLIEAARALAFRRADLAEPILRFLLDLLSQTPPRSAEGVSILDLALHELLDQGHEEAAIAAARQLLTTEDAGIDLEELDGFFHGLKTGPAKRLGRVIVDWLVSGSTRVWRELASGLDAQDGAGAPFEIAEEITQLSPSDQAFLARKATGWFFLKPSIAVTVLLDLLRHGAAENHPAIVQLLINPLLLNFGEVRTRLEAVASSDEAYPFAQEALEAHRGYIEGLHSVPEIAELKPSERKLEIQRQQRQDEMQEAMDAGKRGSSILDFVKKSVLLHGHRSISYARMEKGAELQSFEMDLGTHSVSFEHPRMDIIDPVGLDYMLRVLRVERRPA